MVKYCSEAKTLKEENTILFYVNITVIIALIHILVYAIYDIEYTTTILTKIHAHIGDSDAQHKIAQRYFLGKGVERNLSLALHWFRQAADQGHGYASYNLALAHLHGYHRLQTGEAHRLIKHAATQGIKEANDVLDILCKTKNCDLL